MNFQDNISIIIYESAKVLILAIFANSDIMGVAKNNIKLNDWRVMIGEFVSIQNQTKQKL